MSAGVEIQAAIDKLEILKAKSTAGPWFLTYEKSTHPRLWGNASENDADPVAVAQNGGNAELIVILHRTIDAQLAVLAAALVDSENLALVGLELLHFHAATALARAINGGTL